MSEVLQVGKYRIIAELGHGGMADVYLAVVEGPAGSGFAKLAVVKRLRPHLVEDPEFVAMLIDEARVTARLNHPNVVQMLEVAQEGTEYFLAMEYLDGQPLHRLDRRAARAGLALPKEATYLIAADTLAGLHHAHELKDYDGASSLNIVHRDVTPHNIFVTYDGQVKVVDFGIAKAAGRIAETQHGVVKGKIRYMSPEQALGQSVDRRSDIFAAGIIVWQAATGMRFWQDVDELGIVHSLAAGTYEPSPRALCPDVPEAIDLICRKALAENPADRYATAAEMQADLEAYLSTGILAVRRDLVTLLGTLFAKERAQLKGILNASVGALATTSVLAPRMPPASDVPPVVTTLGPMSLGFRDDGLRTRTLNGGLSEMLEPSLPSPVAPVRARSQLGLVATLSAMLVAVMLMVVAVVQSARPAAASSRHAAATVETELRSLTRASDRVVSARTREVSAPAVVTVYVAAPAPRRTADAAAAPPTTLPNPTLVPASPSRPVRSGHLNIDSNEPWSAGNIVKANP